MNCNGDVCNIENMPSPMINNINLHKSSNTIVNIGGRKMIQFSIEIKPDYPTRYSSLETRGGNLFFNNDPDEKKIIKKDQIYFKNGFNTKKWIIGIQIPFEQRQFEISFLSTYCDLNLSPFLIDFFKKYPFITIEGYGECKFLTLHNSIMIQI